MIGDRVRFEEHRDGATDDAWSPDQRSLAAVLAVTSRILVAEFHRRMDTAGYHHVRQGSGNVFEHLEPGGSTIAAMSQRAGTTPQAMVELVDYLEGRGYVRRVPDPSDRRAKLVVLTEAGRAARDFGRATLAAIQTEWGALVGAGRLDAAVRTLSDLLAALQADQG